MKMSIEKSEAPCPWELSCKIWANSDGAIYSETFTAPAPSKNFLQIFVTSQQVILRTWKILPPTRASANQPPLQIACSYDEFADDEKIRGEIQRNMGVRELAYLDQLVGSKHMDCLNRLPRKVLLRIAFLLDLVSIARLGQTNKLFRELCSCDALWSKIYQDHSKKPASQELLMLVDLKGWKEVFFMNKLQLQMQMRRTAKESRSFFLTSNRQHSSEEEENSPSDPAVYCEQLSDSDSERPASQNDRHHGREHLPPQEYGDGNHLEQLREDRFMDQYQKGDSEYAAYQYDEDYPQQYEHPYPDDSSEIHRRYPSEMNTPEPVIYQE